MSILRNSRPVCLGLALVLVALGAGAPRAAAEAPAATPPPEATPDLTGVWILDTKASDDLKAFAKALGSLLPAGGQRGTGGPGGGMGGPGGGMGGPPPGGGKGGSGAGMDGRMPADEMGSGAEGPHETTRGGQGSAGGPGAGLARAAQQLLISVDGDALEIVDATDRSMIWVPDGVVHAQAGPGGRELSCRAEWQNGVLILEQLGGPLTSSRRLQLSDDGQRLVVELSVLGADGEPVTAHLEYAGVK